MRIRSLSSLLTLTALSAQLPYPPIPPPKVSDKLKVEGHVVLAKAPAKGVQIYTCKADGSWSSPAVPDALLFDGKGAIVMHHYKGPAWEAADGSKVTGALPPKAADTPNPNAIPWLLLDAGGTGKFSNVKFVQRTDTEGGKAPATGCDKDHAGTEARIDYKANYYFYVPGK
jgi:hypothetical protein